MLTLLVVLTSASPVATGLEISSTGSLPPHERSHRNRSHALHRAQRRHPRHGFSWADVLPASLPRRCGPSFCSQRRPVRVVRRSPVTRKVTARRNVARIPSAPYFRGRALLSVDP